MNNGRETTQEGNPWWLAMLRDVQFWVPLAVFLGGLILLSSIQ